MEKNRTYPGLGEVVAGSSDKVISRRISQELKAGLLRKLAPRLYTNNLTDDPQKIVLRNWYQVLSLLFPGSILSYRSAIEGRPAGGHIFLTYTYTRTVKLPGLTVHLLEGPENAAGTMPFFQNLYRSNEERAFLENMQGSRSNAAIGKTLTREQLEEKLDAIIRARGEQAINNFRDTAKAIAVPLAMTAEFEQLNKLISALLSTGASKILSSPLAQARAAGEPFDPARIDLFHILYQYLTDQTFESLTDKNTTPQAYNNFAFFESYFSNFIEGTEFEVEEAKEIIRSETPMPLRDEDSHDVLGTYQIVADKHTLSICPASPLQLVELLRTRHKILLSARANKMPGHFKDKNNKARNTEFVDWQLVSGTLKKGYELYQLLSHPFARAAYMMFLITEVHPFLDGNGRIARVMMNAELTSNDLSKIMIPTVYRIDYIGAIKRLTNRQQPKAYVDMLYRAYQFSATVYGNDMSSMNEYLKTCNAFESDTEVILKFNRQG